MRLSDFDYHLPKELIAQYPLPKRDSARLLVLNRKDKSIEHLYFKDLLKFLHRGELLVMNDTKVMPARLAGRRLSGGKVEVLLLKNKAGLNFEALIKPGRLKLGEKIIFDGGKVFATLKSKNEISFCAKDITSIYSFGSMPLPPYIKRQPEELDRTYYQTVYARSEGAVAAPTAGLHFTKGLLRKIEFSGINLAYLTLHVGVGTFRPVKRENIVEHKMEKEYFYIPHLTAKILEQSKKKKKRIIAVGTTSLRALESYKKGKPEGNTGLFIYPGYKFKHTDCLLTNFHLPKSTLFMLVCAFAGTKLIKKAYREAIEKRYRFYSYGDCMLIF